MSWRNVVKIPVIEDSALETGISVLEGSCPILVNALLVDGPIVPYVEKVSMAITGWLSDEAAYELLIDVCVIQVDEHASYRLQMVLRSYNRVEFLLSSGDMFIWTSRQYPTRLRNEYNLGAPGVAKNKQLDNICWLHVARAWKDIKEGIIDRCRKENGELRAELSLLEKFNVND